MQQMLTIAAQQTSGLMIMLGGMACMVVVVVFFVVIIAIRYKRCPANQILVVYGLTAGGSARCKHGGGAFVWPLIQDYAYLSLDPIAVDIPIEDVPKGHRDREGIPAKVTVAISTHPAMMDAAAERLLNCVEEQIRLQAQDIILDQLRLALEQGHEDDNLKDAIRQRIGEGLNHIGMEVLSMRSRSFH